MMARIGTIFFSLFDANPGMVMVICAVIRRVCVIALAVISYYLCPEARILRLRFSYDSKIGACLGSMCLL
jgi:hypothetical protein